MRKTPLVLRSAAWLALLLVALPIPTAFAVVERATAEAIARESGLTKALEELLPDFHTDLDRAVAESGEKTDHKVLEELERHVDVAFAPERLRDVAFDVFARELDPAHVPVLQAWYASPIGKAVTKAEMAAPGDQEGMRKLRKEGAALLEQVGESRRDLLEDVLLASGTKELVATIAIQTTLTMAAIFRRAQPSVAIPSESRMKAQFEAARPRVEREMAASLLQIFTGIYRKIPDAQLREYEAMLTSPAGRHMSRVGSMALEAALVAGTAHFWQDSLPTEKIPAP